MHLTIRRKKLNRNATFETSILFIITFLSEYNMKYNDTYANLYYDELSFESNTYTKKK